jgi:hypothetical protein
VKPEDFLLGESKAAETEMDDEEQYLALEAFLAPLHRMREEGIDGEDSEGVDHPDHR